MSLKEITPLFPMVVQDNTGFITIKEDTPIEAIKFNLRNILLTNPGENLSDPDFGVGLKKSLFELETTSDITTLKERILKQIKIYANYFTELEVYVKLSGEFSNTLTVRLEFQYGLKMWNDSLEVSVSI
tara:strand:+ start:1057 stop:1443 length:387 start_codon:yes stop_codon:yes gene_type:complete